VSKPTVTLTLAGDESKLTESFDKVGAASKRMETKVGGASDKMKESGSALENLTERADNGETRFQGMADVIGGVTEGFAAWNDESLSTTEKIQTMSMAAADLAGGLVGFLLPVLGQVATFLKTQLLTAMNFIAAHPLIFALLALVAVFALLWANSETFRRIVIDVFNAVGGFIKDVFGAAIGWIVDRWNDMINWFKGLPGRIGDALGAIGRFVGDAFKAGLNVAIDIINWFVRRANDLIDGINWVSPFGDIPHIPQIGRMHNGGIVGGAPGTEQLKILQAGEQVTAARNVDGGSGQAAVVFGGDTDSAFATAFERLVQTGVITIVVA
jgi:hypothetical protein